MKKEVLTSWCEKVDGEKGKKNIGKSFRPILTNYLWFVGILKREPVFFPRHSEFWIGTVTQSCKLKIKG